MDDPSSIAAIYLSDDMLGLRAPLIGDAAVADRWHEGPGTSREQVEASLRREETVPWGANPAIRLIAIVLDTGDVAGGVVVTRSSNRTCRLAVTCPEGKVRAGTLRRVLALVVPWLLDEVGLMTVVVRIAADDVAMIAAAEAAGMRLAVRRREHIRRETGRVDLLDFERVNMEWGRYAG